MPAYRHLSLMISKSCNDCTDALLAAVGGPRAVNKWMEDAGIEGFQLTRDIATLIREDGRIDPAWSVDTKDSATPRAMGQLLAGIYQGKWLSDYSRRVLLDAMEETTTGKQRMRSALPLSANLAIPPMAVRLPRRSMSPGKAPRWRWKTAAARASSKRATIAIRGSRPLPRRCMTALAEKRRTGATGPRRTTAGTDPQLTIRTNKKGGAVRLRPFCS